VLFPVSLVLLVVVLIVLVKLLSETCVAVVACSLLPGSGAAGTVRSMLTRNDMLLCPQSLHLLFLLLFSLVVTGSSLFRSFHSLSQILLKELRRQRKLLSF
jgi:hypothetical protein